SRRSRGDAVLAALALAHGAVLAMAPPAPVVALGLWWSSNTISHHAVHRPFFRRRFADRLLRLYLTAVLGIPQSLWRSRPLAHHAGAPWRLRWTRALAVESALVLAVWTLLAAAAPAWFLAAYLPGWLLGLGLCALHGHHEHARGTTSHY